MGQRPSLSNTGTTHMKKLLVGLLALYAIMAYPAAAQVYAPIPVPAAALSNTAVTVKAGAGTLQWTTCGNPNASVVYIQLFDVSGSVTVGTTPNSGFYALPASTSFSVPLPATFFNAIKVAATTTPGGGTAPGSAVNCTFGIN